MRNRTIQYGICQDTGLVISRINSEVAIPILDFEGMTPENNFETDYSLIKDSVFKVLPFMTIKWTRKIDQNIKNSHREFWGMKKLKLKS